MVKKCRLTMLKITHIARNSMFAILILEGKIIGKWVAELKRVCKQYLSEGKRIGLDLSEVRSVDKRGIKMLNDLATREVQLSNCSLNILNMMRSLSEW